MNRRNRKAGKNFILGAAFLVVILGTLPLCGCTTGNGSSSGNSGSSAKQSGSAKLKDYSVRNFFFDTVISVKITAGENAEELLGHCMDMCGEYEKIFSIAFSSAGATLSLLCMQLAKRSGKFDTVGVSIIGGVTHNAGQILVAMLIVENARVGYYFFILAISGVIIGMIIGIISGDLTKRMRRAIRASHGDGSH